MRSKIKTVDTPGELVQSVHDMIINSGKVYVGCDPGISGAVAFVFPDGHVTFVDPPTYQTQYKCRGVTRNRNHYYIPRLVAQIKEQISGFNTTVCIEKVSSRPADGVQQAFSLGNGFGIYQGIFGVLCSGVTLLVAPVVWKRKLGLLKKDKEASRLLALELYPQCSGELSRKKDSDRAEALLLAHYLRCFNA